jgi:hypothetical protein
MVTQQLDLPLRVVGLACMYGVGISMYVKADMRE